MEAVGFGYLALLLFLVVLGFLWLLLPFAVFGIKDRMDEHRDRLDKVIDILLRIEGRMPLPKD